VRTVIVIWINNTGILPEKLMDLPNFLGLGAQRAGSSWLYKLLQTHPDIYLPERCKEVHYFDRYYYRGIKWYKNFFHTHNSYKYTGEITPIYLYNTSVPEKYII
jgi:hypothetical protein